MADTPTNKFAISHEESPAHTLVIEVNSSSICENEVKKQENNCKEDCNESSGGDNIGAGGSITPCSSASLADVEEDQENVLAEIEEDSKSCNGSDKDSGVGKSSSSGSSDTTSGRNSSNSSSGGGETISKAVTLTTTTTTSGGSGDTTNNKFSRSTSAVDLDTSSSFLWGASLFYHTGIPAPKVKERHFITSPSSPTTPPPSKASSSTSLFKKSSKLFRSTLSLRGLSEESMDDHRSSNNHQNKSPWRFGGSSSKKFNTLPVKIKSPYVVDSSTPIRPAGSSAVTTPDSGFLSGTGGGEHSEGTFRKLHSQEISPLRRRHANCVNSSSALDTTPTTTVGGGMMGNLRGRIKNNSNSLRLFKKEGSSRPSIPDFGENQTNSLPRSPRKQKICEENMLQQTNMSEDTEKPSQSSSSSGFKSAKKALRNSFKAARNLLPGSLSKIGPSSASSTGKTGLKSCTSKEKLNSGPFGDGNVSAPNTPAVIKKSRLERARKKFSSTLSLHTGGSSSSSGNSTNGSCYASGGGGGRSKSTSTLVISDSEACSRVPYGTVPYSRQHATSTEDNLDLTLAVVNPADQELQQQLAKRKGTPSSSSGSKSPFRFISRSKGNKEKKADTVTTINTSSDSQGFVEIQQEQHQSQQEREPESNFEVHFKNTQQHATADVVVVAEKERPTKTKRMSLVKSLMGKTILRGSSSKLTAAADGGENKEEMKNNSSRRNSGGSKKEPVIFYKTSGGTMPSMSSSSKDLETSKLQRSSSGGAGTEENQEIITFANEPRVRTPKIGRRQRLSSGGSSGNTTASSSVTCTPPPPPLPLSSPPRESTTTTTPNSSREKDREFAELEVSETSIDISPVKKNLNRYYDDYDVINKTKNNEGGKKIVSGGESSADKLKKSSPQKKSKSQSLINSLISLSPSSSFSVGKKNTNMEQETGNSGGSKKKRKNMKKVNNKRVDSQETTTTTTTVHSKAAEDRSLAATKAEQSNKENNDDDLSSKTTPTATLTTPRISGGEQRRKSSEDFKELRKNAGVLPPTNGVVGLEESTFVGEASTQPENPVGKDGQDDDDEDNKESADNEVDETDGDETTACTDSFRQLKPFNYDLEPVEEGKKERLYKVLVVGELGAGKTSIIKRYVHQFFSQHYRATIGVDFALKVLRWDPDTVVRLQLWDIAGQERFGSMTRVYYKEAVGAFVVFDVTRSATLEAVPKWKADLDAKVALPDGRPIPTVLLANKSDQPKEGIAASREKMNEFCQQQGFSAWFETSAKDNINIDESANFLVSKILEMDKWSQEPLAPDPDKVELTANGKYKGSSSSNCAC